MMQKSSKIMQLPFQNISNQKARASFVATQKFAGLFYTLSVILNDATRWAHTQLSENKSVRNCEEPFSIL